MNSKLKMARLASGFSQMQVAKLVGISYTTLSAYEHGSSVPSLKVFKRLQRILELDGDYSDYFDHPQKTGRKRKYEGALCKVPGCTKPPAAGGMCMNHYTNAWKKTKNKERDRLLNFALTKLAEYERKEKKGEGT